MKTKHISKGNIKAVCIAWGILLMGMLAGCGSGKGEPYIVTMSGVEVKPGQTTVQELADAGYEFTDLGGRSLMPVEDENGNKIYLYESVYDLTSEAEAKTEYSMIIMVKDGEQAASVSLINESSESVPVSECIISYMTIDIEYKDADKIMVEGISFDQLSIDKLVEVLGKQSGKLNDSTTRWQRGDYSLNLEISEDGGPKKISVSKYYNTEILGTYKG